MSNIRTDIFNTGILFEEKALAVYRFQVEHNKVYSRFNQVFGFNSRNLPEYSRIPLLPIQAFRDARVLSRENSSGLFFRSSGTTQMKRSIHEVPDPKLYEESVCRGFDYFYPGNPILGAYTPRYEDNPDSSLVRMMKLLINRDPQGLSRFLPTGEPVETEWLKSVTESGRKLILFGAAFGLLDLGRQSRIRLPENTVIIETGGMKTERREISRDNLHQILADDFELDVSNIHSEYGMCELLSQAYSSEDGWFQSVPWMKITVRDADDPFRICKPGEEGLIGVADLANLYSCAFLLTGDRGVMDSLNRFQVYGRWNPENLRGCNFLIDRE